MNLQLQKIKDEIKKQVKGKDEIIDKVLCAMIAGGHVLLEDIPGVGKTTLAMSISQAMALSYKRVQFTPDVMPSDITGFNMFNSQKNAFEYHEGAAMCNLLLADEINRTSPKTQSALLEVMEEGRVTVDGYTRYIPQPFSVIATQNPFGSAGTQKLPESQLDRFMIRLSMGYPSHDAAVDILKEDLSQNRVLPVVTIEQLLNMKESVQSVYVDDSLFEYVINFSEATRSSEYVDLGLSPRGSKALLRMAKASAYMDYRSFVSLDDIVKNIPCTVKHRLVLNSRAKAKDVDIDFVVKKILSEVRAPKGVS